MSIQVWFIVELSTRKIPKKSCYTLDLSRTEDISTTDVLMWQTNVGKIEFSRWWFVGYYICNTLTPNSSFSRNLIKSFWLNMNISTYTLIFIDSHCYLIQKGILFCAILVTLSKLKSVRNLMEFCCGLYILKEARCPYSDLGNTFILSICIIYLCTCLACGMIFGHLLWFANNHGYENQSICLSCCQQSGQESLIELMMTNECVFLVWWQFHFGFSTNGNHS